MSKNLCDACGDELDSQGQIFSVGYANQNGVESEIAQVRLCEGCLAFGRNIYISVKAGDSDE